jgi:hypothetical protein
MKTKTLSILKIMKIITWIVFIGLCIKAGSIIISFFVSLFISQDAVKNLYLGLTLIDVYQTSIWHYIVFVTLLVLLTSLEAYIAYLVTRIFLKLNLDHPFSVQVNLLVLKISHVALATGLVSLIANGYSKYLIGEGISLHFNWGTTEFIFLSGIIYILAQILRRGIEIQSENELTI